MPTLRAPKRGAKIPPYAQRMPRTALKPSAKHFVWPTLATPEQRAPFAAAIYELMTERKLNPMQFAVDIFGGVQAVKGPRPTRASEVRAWLRAERVPGRKIAEEIARYFGVPLERLLTPRAPLNPAAIAALFRPRAPNGGSKANGANGHDHHAAAPDMSEGVRILMPPSGAKPVKISLDTLSADANFAVITITGTVSWEQAQTIMQILKPLMR